ncbi:MAG: Spy/CpxP family protein refolding chaperone [Mariprofundaceae bacterium]|nr:Spy/CpxP family protein refolding chaperone [Mariprofundaceae bacterium]
MKHNSKIILSTLGILAIVGITTGAMASDGNCKRGSSGFDGSKVEHRIDKMKERLNLTDQQAGEIRVILEAKKGMKRHGDRREARRALMQLDPSAPDYMKQVEKLAHQQGKAMVQKIEADAQTRKQIYAILTPEQREKARSMHEKRMDRFKGRQHRDSRDHSSHGKNRG